MYTGVTNGDLQFAEIANSKNIKITRFVLDKRDISKFSKNILVTDDTLNAYRNNMVKVAVQLGRIFPTKSKYNDKLILLNGPLTHDSENEPINEYYFIGRFTNDVLPKGASGRFGWVWQYRRNINVKFTIYWFNTDTGRWLYNYNALTSNNFMGMWDTGAPEGNYTVLVAKDFSTRTETAIKYVYTPHDVLE